MKASTISSFTFRPTPSRRLSLTRRPQMVPRPQAWDEQATITIAWRAER